MFKRSDQDSRRSVHIVVDGAAVEAREGDSVSAALLTSGRDVRRATAVSGAPRLPYCMMGVCFDCLAEVDGVASVQTCLATVRDGMRVARQRGKRSLVGKRTLGA